MILLVSNCKIYMILFMKAMTDTLITCGTELFPLIFWLRGIQVKDVFHFGIKYILLVLVLKYCKKN